MLPTKVMQLDYQDFATIVLDSIPKILTYQKEKEIEFSCVLGKLRNGSVAASIVANELKITMGVYYAPRKILNFKDEVFIPQEILIKLNDNAATHILFVDSISGTGNTIIEAKKIIAEKYGEKIKLHAYSVLCDSRAMHLSDITGIVSERFFQPPWEFMSNTPSSHLDRLSTGNIKGSNEDSYALGYSSQKCKNSFMMAMNKDFNIEWEIVFELLDTQRKLQSSSGVSTVEVPDFLSFEEARGRYALLLSEKEKFITSNGLTHYIENDCVQAMILSEKCPVTHIFYFDGQELSKIYAKNIKKESFIS